MKKFMLGFILAAMLFSAAPISAAVQQYILSPSTAKLMVDGTEVKDAKLPMMVYEGYNYVPAATFKAICDKMGIGFKWDGAKKEIQVSTKAVTSSVGKVGASVSTEVKYTPDGLKAKLHEGEWYVYVTDIVQKYVDEFESKKRQSRYTLQPVVVRGEENSKTATFVKGEGLGGIRTTTVLISDVPLFTPGGSLLVEFDYYVNSILPLIE